MNPLWTDEREVLENLTSIKYLIHTYLPSIPGGSPGFYLLIYPFKQMFGSDRILLGMPGLISHIIVFFLIPKVVGLLFQNKIYSQEIITVVTRLGFVLDPTLSFQAMELRPYAFLPLLWCCSVLVVNSLLQIDFLSWRKSILKQIGVLSALFIIFNWHFYGFLMTLSVYIYFLTKNKYSPKKIFKMKSIPTIFLTILLSVPIWRYFSSGSFKFHFNTFEWLNTGIIDIYFLNNASMHRSTFQQIAFWLFIPVIFIFIMKGIVVGMKQEVGIYKKRFEVVLRSFILLFLFPSGMILILDLINRYWFLARQISWTFISVYMGLGILASYFLRKHTRLRSSSKEVQYT